MTRLYKQVYSSQLTLYSVHSVMTRHGGMCVYPPRQHISCCNAFKIAYSASTNEDYTFFLNLNPINMM